MYYVLVFLHLLVCIALIAIVLLQSGKGAEMGASFGTGGSSSVFGAGGGTTFMSKLTTSAAIIFMLTSLTLAYLSGKTGAGSIMPTTKAAAPAPQSAPPAGAPAPQQAAPAPAQAPAQTPAPAPAPAKK